MNHYIHCHQGFDLNKGGSVGYISSLCNSFNKFNPLFTTANNIKCNFIFPDIAPDDRLPNQPLKQILDPRFNYINNYVNNGANQAYINQRKKWFREIIPISEYMKINSKNITSVHIHGAYNFLPVYNSLVRMGVESRVVKILTTHNPFKPECEDIELITRGRNFKKEDIDVFKYFYNERDHWAFNLADALLFPTKESMEGYYETWPEFENIVKNKPVFFCTTATESKKFDTSKDEIRKQLNIPSDAIVLLYLGRFVKVRGYDVLIEAAKQIITKNKKVYFVVVGEKSVPQINSNRWIQLPFTTKPGNFINAADAVLCPNRGSLFDLSMIETLSLGKPIICSYVGGYKWLKDKIPGVFYAEKENVKSLIDTIKSFLTLSSQQIDDISSKNKIFYENYLSLENFQKNYCNTVDEIYKYFEISAKYTTLSFCDKVNTYLSEEPVNNQILTSTVAKKDTKVNLQKEIKTAILPQAKKAVLMTKNATLNNQKKELSPTRRKLRKLVRNPKLYFADMIKKRIGRIK